MSTSPESETVPEPTTIAGVGLELLAWGAGGRGRWGKKLLNKMYKMRSPERSFEQLYFRVLESGEEGVTFNV
jgi:hypothetical protein